MSRNIHIYPAPISNESRMLKETSALARSELFDQIDLVGHSSAGLPENEPLARDRRIIRIGSLSKDKQNYGMVGKCIWFAVWMLRVFAYYRRSDVTSVNAHSVAVLPLAWFVARSNQALLVYDTHELETETPTMVGMKRRLLRGVERAFVRKCDLVVVVNQGIAEWYSDRYDINTPLVVRNIPEDASKGRSVPTLRSMLDVPDKVLLFVHTGRLAGGRNIPSIISAFSDPKTIHHVLFLGDGPMLDLITAARVSNPNIHHLPPVAHDEVVTWVKGADAGLCLIENISKSYEYALPNKFAEYLLAGIPVVSTYLSEAHRIIGPAYLETVIRNIDAEFAPLIQGLTRENLGRFSSAAAREGFPTWEEETSEMVKSYRVLLAAKGA